MATRTVVRLAEPPLRAARESGPRNGSDFGDIAGIMQWAVRWCGSRLRRPGMPFGHRLLVDRLRQLEDLIESSSSCWSCLSSTLTV